MKYAWYNVTCQSVCLQVYANLRMFIVVLVEEVHHSGFLLQSSDCGKALQRYGKMGVDWTPS